MTDTSTSFTSNSVDMADMYRRGHTLATIADIAGCSASHVYQTLRKQGLSRKDKGTAVGGGEQRVQSMYDEYMSGKSLDEVGKPYGVTKQCVYQLFKARNLLKEGSRYLKGSEPDKVQAMIALYKDGKTLSQIGARYDLSSSQVHQIFKVNGISKKDKGSAHGKREASFQKMQELYAAGKTLAEIGQEVGISRQRVQQIFKANGISSQNNGVKVRAQARKDAIRETTAKRIKEIWDMELEDYEAHVAQYGSSGRQGSPMHRYIEQRRNCMRKARKWEFTFPTWWAMWVASGKWDERGVGQYGLGVEGDASTPMGPNTCRVTSLSEIICGDFFTRKRKSR